MVLMILFIVLLAVSGAVTGVLGCYALAEYRGLGKDFNYVMMMSLSWIGFFFLFAPLALLILFSQEEVVLEERWPFVLIVPASGSAMLCWLVTLLARARDLQSGRHS